jgi:hypothetical protein
MTELPIDKPENEQDRSAGVTTEIVQPRGKLLACCVAAALVCGFFVVDVIMTSPWLRGTDVPDWLQGILIGLCIGQVNLIATWASLAPGNIVLRVSWSFLLTMAMWYGLIFGSQHSWGVPSSSEMSPSDAILLLAILMGGVVILQIPLWIAKKAFRWRLTRQPGDTVAALQEDRQFHLQHLLIAAFLLAVALSPLHYVLPPGQVDSWELDGEVCVLLAAAVLSNVVMTLPCIWWAFASRRKLIGLVVTWLVYCAVLAAIESVIFCALIDGPWMWRDAAVFFYAINLSQCVVVLGTLWILRAIGFRMVRLPCRGRQTDTPPSAEIAATEQA